MFRLLAGLSLVAGTLAAASSARTTAPIANAPNAAATVMQVYKSPTCGCCKAWIDKMKAAGFEVRVTDLGEEALQAEKTKRGVGDNLASCHTAVVNGYVVEGHVPAADIQRMLREKPAIVGIAAPGMPRGSPGMEMPNGAKDPYDVVAFTKAGKTTVFARH
ncbi:MAG: DUF411 domain-containing protein [Gemmatimonadaceae bacterium]|nr:DUF411 domain-containing protein [Gemmatimonadaceae bacterium]